MEPGKALDAAVGELAKQGTSKAREWIVTWGWPVIGSTLITALSTSAAIKWLKANPLEAIIAGSAGGLVLMIAFTLWLDRRATRKQLGVRARPASEPHLSIQGVQAYRPSIQLGSLSISSVARSVAFDIVIQRWKGVKPLTAPLKITEIRLGDLVLVDGSFEAEARTGITSRVWGGLGRWGIYTAEHDSDEKIAEIQTWGIRRDVRHEAAEQLKQKVGRGLTRLIVRCSAGEFTLLLAVDAEVQ